MNQIELKLEPSSTDLARMRMRFRSAAKVIGPQEIFRELMMKVSLDVAGKITGCSIGDPSVLVDETAEGRGCGPYPANTASARSHRDQEVQWRSQALSSFCNQQSYPMKSSGNMVLPPTGCFTQDQCARQQNAMTQERGPYATKKQCTESPIFNEGHTMIFDPNASGAIYAAGNGQWVDAIVPVTQYICINHKWTSFASAQKGSVLQSF